MIRTRNRTLHFNWLSCIFSSVEKNWKEKLKITLRMVLYLVAENYVLAKNVKRHTFIIKISIVNQLLPWRKVSL